MAPWLKLLAVQPREEYISQHTDNKLGVLRMSAAPALTDMVSTFCQHVHTGAHAFTLVHMHSHKEQNTCLPKVILHSRASTSVCNNEQIIKSSVTWVSSVFCNTLGDIRFLHTCNPSTGMWGQEDWEFKAIFSYRINSRPA